MIFNTPSIQCPSLLYFPLTLFLFTCSSNIENFSDAMLSESYSEKPTWSVQYSGTTERFQAISIVDHSTVWVSGTGGTYSFTTDGGVKWHTDVVPGAEDLQFRDVYAINAQSAFLMSSGTGSDSRIYKTTNSGAHWELQYTLHEPEGFLDCMDFWDEQRGLVYGDSIEGQLYVLSTQNGGDSWQRIEAKLLPEALSNEGGFAASGTCLVTGNDGRAWIGTGGSGIEARVLRTNDFGEHWSFSSTPVVGDNNTAGILSLAFLNQTLGAALGGDISNPNQYSDNVAVTEDGGHSWKLAARPVFTGAIYGASYIPFEAVSTLVAVGPGGSNISRDNGDSWEGIDSISYWAVSFISSNAGWAVGPEGLIAKFADSDSALDNHAVGNDSGER